MQKHRRLLAGIACFVASVAALALLCGNEEPQYEGRTISRWLMIYYESDRANADRTQRPVAAAAILTIGTNGLPLLQKWLSYESPGWHRHLARVLPRSVGNSRPIRATVYRNHHRSEAARLGLKLLGTNAVGAIPALTSMVDDASHPQTARRAIQLLSGFGPAAFPTLQAALENTNHPYRVYIASSMAVSAAQFVGTNNCLPAFKALMTDPDPELRFWAARMVNRLEGNQSTNSTDL